MPSHTSSAVRSQPWLAVGGRRGVGGWRSVVGWRLAVSVEHGGWGLAAGRQLWLAVGGRLPVGGQQQLAVRGSWRLAVGAPPPPGGCRCQLAPPPPGGCRCQLGRFLSQADAILEKSAEAYDKTIVNIYVCAFCLRPSQVVLTEPVYLQSIH